MRECLTDLRSARNPKARIKILEGHFATVNSHINTYIDMSTVKCRHNNGRETARVLANHFQNNTMIDTIVCLDGTELIGAFMAEFLADTGIMSINSGKNISIITPDVNAYGQLVFMDSTLRMIKHMQVLVLAASVTTGQTITRAAEAVSYYGGTVRGVAAIFSNVEQTAEGMEIFSIFQKEDLPDYQLIYRRNARCAVRRCLSMPLSTVSATQNCKKRTGQIYSFMVDYKVNGGHRYDDERFKENFIKIKRRSAGRRQGFWL